MPAQNPRPEWAISDEEGKVLLGYARACIGEELGGPVAERPSGARYERQGASFVTLRRAGGELQGCIGSTTPHRPLALDVAKNAVAAATLDPRARPLLLSDVSSLGVELSVLSPLVLIEHEDEEEAILSLRPPEDGVLLLWRGRRATFLPQMWERLPDRHEFIAALKDKAGMGVMHRGEAITLFRYSVQKFTDGPAS